MNECSPLVLASPVGGSVESRRNVSDASGEAGSQQGWSVLGPPRDMCKRNLQPGNVKKKPRKPQSFLGVFGCKKLRLMVRETVPSQQQQHLATCNRIKTTASSSLEKFASDCLNQNGDLSHSGREPCNRNSCICPSSAPC